MYGTVAVYPTPDSLKDKIDEYFEQCFVQMYSEKYDRQIPYCIHPPTFSGMARYLGFPSRVALLAYRNKSNPLYEEIIDSAKLRIEEYYEEKLILAKGPSTGIQFALKNNCGWDEQTRKTLTDDGSNQLVISWDPTASDVIDAQTKEALPAPKKPFEQKFEEPQEEEGVVITVGNQ